jgi:hypothetical protein
VGRTVISIDGIGVDPRSLNPSPLAILRARTSNAMVTTLASNLLPLPYAINITLVETTRTLILPIDRSFIENFLDGLSTYHFGV